MQQRKQSSPEVPWPPRYRPPGDAVPSGARLMHLPRERQPPARRLSHGLAWEGLAGDGAQWVLRVRSGAASGPGGGGRLPLWGSYCCRGPSWAGASGWSRPAPCCSECHCRHHHHHGTRLSLYVCPFCPRGMNTCLITLT